LGWNITGNGHLVLEEWAVKLSGSESSGGLYRRLRAAALLVG